MSSAKYAEGRFKHLIGRKINNAGTLIGCMLLEYTLKMLKTKIAQNGLQISFKFFIVATAASS